MARNSIHMAVGLPGKNGVISGMRSSCEVVVEVNINKAVHSAVPFFVSKNDVVLSPGIGEKGFLPKDYFRTVMNFKTGELIYSQPFEYLCVYDLECNCDEDRQIQFNEIIELPVVIIDVK